jgi:MFS family permease
MNAIIFMYDTWLAEPLCVGQVFLGEVAEPSMRGLLASIPYVSYSMGIFIVYTLGAALHWQTVAWLATILPVLSFVSFTLMPESPVWLVRNNRVEEAGEALNWLRGSYDGGIKVRMSNMSLQASLSKAAVMRCSGRRRPAMRYICRARGHDKKDTVQAVP